VLLDGETGAHDTLSKPGGCECVCSGRFVGGNLDGRTQAVRPEEVAWSACTPYRSSEARAHAHTPYFALGCRCTQQVPVAPMLWISRLQVACRWPRLPRWPSSVVQQGPIVGSLVLDSCSTLGTTSSTATFSLDTPLIEVATYLLLANPWRHARACYYFSLTWHNKHHTCGRPDFQMHGLFHTNHIATGGLAQRRRTNEA
jgi:hypothetical protein